jgi:hypothetical protein
LILGLPGPIGAQGRQGVQGEFLIRKTRKLSILKLLTNNFLRLRYFKYSFLSLGIIGPMGLQGDFPTAN